MTMTKEQAESLAYEVNIIRPGWPINEILAAIGKVPPQRTYEQTRAAALDLARNRLDLDHPTVLARDGRHWRAADGLASAPAQQPAPVRCGICGRTRAGHDKTNNDVAAEYRHKWITEDEERRRCAALKRRRIPATTGRAAA
ncbi:MAG: hypothetical protein E7Z97_07225 [Propionibacteriaceae bacterium]|nr:hypothetical protein [Propionibacteriaceae bacterium]